MNDIDKWMWKPCTFTVFNNAVDNGWAIDMRNSTGQDMDISDCEFHKVDMGDSVRDGIKSGNKTLVNAEQEKIDTFNKENYPNMAMFLIQDIGLLYVIRQRND